MSPKSSILAVLGLFTAGLVTLSVSGTPPEAKAKPWTLEVAVQTACQGEILPCT